MAGLCGVLGTDPHEVERIAPGLAWTGDETTASFVDDLVGVHGAFTTPSDADQPVSVGDDRLLWVWGSVFGHAAPGGYRARGSRDDSVAAYCARLCERHGPEFVAGLNGNFIGVLYDRAEGSVSVFTDRLAQRDTYWTRPDETTLVFSTSLQSLSRHPRVTPAFDPDYVGEYFTCGHRTFGVRTPLRGTHRFPPATVCTVDRDARGMEATRYWEPRYRPEDRSFSFFLGEFVRRIRAAVTDRLRSDREHGLFLSGGADSRLVLAAIPPAMRDRITAYHLAGWMSREARIAERVALTAGVDFEMLRRDRKYHERALERTPRLSNFIGRFDQAHAEGFMDELRGEVDAVMTGNFSGSLFGDFKLPAHRLSLGPVGTIPLPVLKPMDRVERHIEYWAGEPPAYLDPSIDVRGVLEREISETGGRVVHHGVEYASVRDLFVCGRFSPRVNGSSTFFLQSLRHHLPAWTPFGDPRLLELCLSIPLKFFVRRNIVHRAIERLDPELAGIASANTGVAIERSFPVHYAGGLALGAINKFTGYDAPPRRHQSRGPWPDRPAIIREQSFVRDALERNEHLIRALPFLDWDGVVECYEAHLAGATNHNELYALLTVLEMPVTRRIAERAAA